MIIELNGVRPTYMEAQELTTSPLYGQKKQVFEAGKRYLIKAQSGQGKTSLLNFIYGASFSYTGHITYNGTFDKKVLLGYRKDKLSYVSQDLKLFPSLTAFENIALKNHLTHYKTPMQIEALLEEVGLSHKRDALVSTLSLGQCQRIAILRALCQPFECLLMDEPFSHLDDANTAILVELLDRELLQRNASLILTTLGEGGLSEKLTMKIERN